MLDRTMLYDLIYALAAIDGREEKLFGDCAPLAHEAFQRGLAGSERSMSSASFTANR